MAHYDDEPKTIVMTDGDILVNRVPEPVIDKLLQDLANLFASRSIDTAYASRYKILEDDLEIVGEDDSDPNNIVPFFSGEISFWCECYDEGVREDVYYMTRKIPGITIDIGEWSDPI